MTKRRLATKCCVPRICIERAECAERVECVATARDDCASNVVSDPPQKKRHGMPWRFCLLHKTRIPHEEPALRLLRPRLIHRRRRSRRRRAVAAL